MMNGTVLTRRLMKSVTNWVGGVPYPSSTPIFLIKLPYISPGPPSHAPNLNAGLASSSNTTCKYNTAVSAYTLLRFSTGQILEDEHQLSWYDLALNELLELYAHAPVQQIPTCWLWASRPRPSHVYTWARPKVCPTRPHRKYILALPPTLSHPR